MARGKKKAGGTERPEAVARAAVFQIRSFVQVSEALTCVPPKPQPAAGRDRTQRHDIHGRMRTEPEMTLEKHGIAAIGFHEERLTHGSLTKSPRSTFRKGSSLRRLICNCCYATRASLANLVLVPGAQWPNRTGIGGRTPSCHNREEPLAVAQHRRHSEKCG
jgi:hypothetical protein